MYFPVKPGTIVILFSGSCHCGVSGLHTGCAENKDVVRHYRREYPRRRGCLSNESEFDGKLAGPETIDRTLIRMARSSGPQGWAALRSTEGGTNNAQGSTGVFQSH